MGVWFDQFPRTHRHASLRPGSRLESVSKKAYCVRGAIGATDAPLHPPLRPRVALDKAGALAWPPMPPCSSPELRRDRRGMSQRSKVI
jgi:hypothetical protein